MDSFRQRRSSPSLSPFYLKLRFECRKYICPPSLPSSDFHSSLVVVPRPPSILSVPSPSRCDVTGREVDPTFGYIKLTFGIPSEFAYGSTWKSHYRMSEYPRVGQVGEKIFIARHFVFWRSKLGLITTIMNIHLESAKLPAATISVCILESMLLLKSVSF